MNKEQFAAALSEAADQSDSKDENPPAGSETEPKGHESAPPAKAEADPKEATRLPGKEDENPPEPKGTKEWLADAGADIAELYDQKIPGTDITWGAAKDAAPDLQDISRLKLDMQQQRDELVTRQTTDNQEFLSVLQRLAGKYGEAEILELVQSAPDDVGKKQSVEDSDLLRFRPELSEKAKWEEAHDQMADVGRVYGISRQHFVAAGAGLRRMALRLHELESYLDTLREPAKPDKQVRQKAKSQPKARGKQSNSRKFSSRGANKFHDQMANAMRE